VASKRGTAKIFTLNRKHCQLQSDLGWSERVNVYSRHVMVLPRNIWKPVGPRAPLPSAGGFTLLPRCRRHCKRILPFPQRPYRLCTQPISRVSEIKAARPWSWPFTAI